MTPRALTLAAGAALIVVTNGFLLGAAAYNRSGSPDSRLALSQREMVWHRYGMPNRENTGLSVQLAWRMPVGERGSPGWLDERHLTELGFVLRRSTDGSGRHNVRVLIPEREAWIVLELAGPAWQAALTQAEERVALRASERQTYPNDPARVRAEEQARQALAREAEEDSRLFAVDAGTDLASLRARYPDRSRYLIQAGTVQVRHVSRGGQEVVSGSLGPLKVRAIHVPHALRPHFEIPPEGRTVQTNLRLTATLASGQRLEPSIESVTSP